VDNAIRQQLEEGARGLGLSGLPPDLWDRLWAYATDLLRWNEKVNLTAITRPDEVAEKHLLDSLAVLPEVGPSGRVLDLGAGAGLPGIPLALAAPGLEVTLVDTVGKKVAFLKAAAAGLGLAPRVKAVQARLAGDPEAEGVGRGDIVISRAFMDVPAFARLGAAYLRPGGRLLAMVGQMPDEATLRAAGEAAGLRLLSTRTWTLPRSGDPRGVVVFQA